MSNTDIINELLSIRATAQVLVDRATKLERKLTEGVSTPSSQSAAFQKKVAEKLSKRGKRYLKN